MIVGEEIFEFRFRSFFLNGSLISEMLVLFFRFSKSGWVSLDIGEGISRILPLESEPVLMNTAPSSDEFVYPVQSSNRLDKYFGKKLISVSEYRIFAIEECCVGVYFDFGDCGFSVLESDDNLSLIDGVAVLPEGQVLSLLEI